VYWFRSAGCGGHRCTARAISFAFTGFRFLRNEAIEERLREPERVNSVMEVIARSARDMGLLDRTSEDAPGNKRPLFRRALFTDRHTGTRLKRIRSFQNMFLAASTSRTMSCPLRLPAATGLLL